MRASRRRRAGWLVLLVYAGASWATTVGAEPRVAATATDLRLAAERFDEGRNAFKVGAFAEAAEHFEAADARAPSASALGLAMRSRAEAGQASRAATLAELVLRRYPEEADLVQRAKAIIEGSLQALGRLSVECDPACDLVVDDKLIHGRASEQWTIYVEPGDHVVAANWSRDRVATAEVNAEAGSSNSLRLSPTAQEPERPATPVPSPAPKSAPISEPPAPPAVNSRKLSPVYFWIGVGATVALGGATAWSGIDALNNPGPDAVRQGCVGLGDSCKLYKEGQNAELRTNVLVGATAVVAVATAITGLFFTDFSRADQESRVGSSGVTIRPWIGALGSTPVHRSAADVLPTMLGAEGRF